MGLRDIKRKFEEKQYGDLFGALDKYAGDDPKKRDKLLKQYLSNLRNV